MCDRSEAARRAAGSRHPGTRLTADLADVLADDRVEAVVVATDAPSHFAIADASLRAGKDVFVEKPLALSSRDADAMVALAEQERRVLMVGHLLLFHPAVTRLRRDRLER